MMMIPLMLFRKRGKDSNYLMSTEQYTVILSHHHTYRALENRHIYLTQISTHPQNSYRMHFHTSTRKMKQVLIAYIYLEENGVDVEIRQVHR